MVGMLLALADFVALMVVGLLVVFSIFTLPSRGTSLLVDQQDGKFSVGRVQ
jgi:hypothetical protein